MAQNHRDETFSRWLGDYQGVIFKVVGLYSDGAHDRNDLFQEIALQLWNSIPRFAENCKESTWIYRVALNTAFAWKRKEGNHTKKRNQFAKLVVTHQADDRTEHNEQLAWLYDRIKTMDEVNRSLILLHLEGQSYEEIADVLGITPGNVGVKLTRLRQQLTAEAKGTRQ